MAYSKTPKADYALANSLITLNEITAVREFIRDFKLKYARKKSVKKKKRVL